MLVVGVEAAIDLVVGPIAAADSGEARRREGTGAVGLAVHRTETGKAAVEDIGRPGTAAAGSPGLDSLARVAAVDAVDATDHLRIPSPSPYPSRTIY